METHIQKRKSSYVVLLTMVVMVLSFASFSYATAYSENFESYDTNSELQSAFLYYNGTLTLETSDVHSESKACKWDFNNASSPYYSYASLDINDSDWSSQDTITLWFKVTAGGTEYFRVRVLDTNMALQGDFYYNGTAATPVGEWTRWDIDLSQIPDANLQHVERFDLLMLAGSYGSGTIIFDDIRHVDALHFDEDVRYQTVEGFGAQIWPADTAGELVMENIHLRYSSLEVGPYWPSVDEKPPTDGNRASFDSYVARNYASNDLTEMKRTWNKTEQLGIINIMDLYHIPPLWEDSNRVLEPAYYDDYAMLWGATIKFFADNGMNITLIEMMNEPDGIWIYNLTPANYNIVLKKVRAELDYRGYTDVGIVGPGTTTLEEAVSYINALDSSGVAALYGFSSHAYDERLDTDCGPEYLRSCLSDFHTAIVNKDPNHSKPKFITEYQCGVYIFDGVTYPDPHIGNYDFSASDKIPFGVRVFENSLSLMNWGVGIPVFWQAADQSWLDQGYGLVRRWEDGVAPRPAYYAMQTLIPRIPTGSRIIKPPTQQNNDIYAAALTKDSRVVVALVNNTNSRIYKTVQIENADSNLAILEAPAYHGGTIIDRTDQLTLDKSTYSGQYSIDVDLWPDCTVTIVCDIPPAKKVEWKFDSNTIDTSGNDNDGSTVGNPQYVTGLVNNCLEFDGNDSVQDLSATGLPTDGNDSWTMNMYLYTDQLPTAGEEVMAGFGDFTSPYTTGGSRMIYSDPNYAVAGNFGNSPEASGTAWRTGYWQMVTASYDGDMFRMYLDGEEIKSGGLPSSTALTTADSVIKVATNIGGTSFTGKIDEFTIWDGVLVQSELDSLASCVPAIEPVLQWKLDETSGTTANDSADSNNHGTLSGSPQWKTSIFDKYLSFDVNDTVVKTNALNLPADANDAWTINAFIYIDGDTLSDANGPIAGFGTCVWSGDGCEQRYLYNYRGVYFWGDGVNIYSGVPYDTGAWQMITATCDGETVRLYKNAVELGTADANFTDATATVRLAGPNNTNFKGKIDDFTIWDVALTPAEIEELMEDMPISPILEWKVDSNTTCKDTSGNGNDGTFTGTPDVYTGVDGNCLYFANGEWISKTGAIGLPNDATDTWSMNVYLYTASSTPNCTIAGFGDGIWSGDGGKQRFLYRYNGYSNFWGDGVDITGNTISTSCWHMITATCDSLYVRLYKDAVLLGSVSASGFTDAIPNVKLAGSISGDTFVGWLDEFTIWNVALSQAEITELDKKTP